MNIDVIARIRPPLRGEGAHNLNVQGTKIRQDETNTAHTFSAVYDDDVSNETIYQDSVSSLVDLVVSGFNCSLLSLGESGAGKSHTLLGDGETRLGVVHLALRGLFDRISDSRERASRADNLLSSEISLSMYEVYNEVVRDLLKGGGSPVAREPSDITVTAQQWAHVKDLTWLPLKSDSDAMPELWRGWNERTQSSTDYGRTQARATLFIEIKLVTDRDEFGYPHQSRFLFAELPGIEKLAENQQELRKREGAVQNKSIVSFGHLVSELSTRQKPDRVINYGESKATQLLDVTIGGNSKTKAIMHLSPNPGPATLKMSLRVSDQLSRIKNFFILNDAAARALIIQYQARLLSLQGQLGVNAVAAATTRDEASDDQAKLARENLKMKEENDYLRRRLDQIQSRFGDVASAKTDLSSRLIGSEEEKLKLSKLLVDLRIENNKLKERGAQENFELKNKVLALENRLIQTESERDRLLRDFRHVRDHFDEMDRERQNVGDRFVDLSADYKALAKKYESEVARNQQLGLELLNLLNAEVTLLKQRDNLGLAGESKRGMGEDLSRVRDIALGLSAERQKFAASDRDRHEVRQNLFGDQDKFRGEIAKMKSHYDNEQDKLQGIISQLNRDLQNMRESGRESQRKLAEAEVELVTLKAKTKELQSTNSKLQLDLKERNEEVRARLVKYLQDVANHIDRQQQQQTGGRGTGEGLKGQVAAMMKDLQKTYRTRESQLSDAARDYKHAADKVSEKHQQLLVEYRILRQQVLEKKIAGLDPGPEEQDLTLDVDEVESANRRELTKVMKKLKETEEQLERTRREGTSDERWKSLKDEFIRTQNELEAERTHLLANNSVLEEQLAECQDYIQSHMTRYKDEIRRLRRELGIDERLEPMGLSEDFGMSRFRTARNSHYPQSLRKYRTLPEI
ncbi:coiled-coil domain-containing protein 78-like [Diadema antillarum]|uniref:coiled-coil domain-containing protein 78-like n=1 Tax=Diadema antillarum TaxID=105358 RepID=UPI003A8C7F60